VDEGIRLGVTVTPAFFIYGQLIMGTHCDFLNFLYINQDSHKMIIVVKRIVYGGRLSSGSHGLTAPNSRTSRLFVSHAPETPPDRHPATLFPVPENFEDRVGRLLAECTLPVP
jgi:hypothetical protein